jgi:GMP synthase (glutamine-hydrolysing)
MSYSPPKFPSGRGDQIRHVAAVRFVPLEDLGLWEQALQAGGASIEYLDPPGEAAWQGRAAKADLLVVLGGPIAVYEAERYPTVSRAMSLIETRLKANRPLLGVCLGAQLIASALGARVYAGRSKEIGWGAIRLTREGKDSPLRSLQDGSPVLHWHGDTFDLPSRCARLAYTDVTENQAFSYGSNVLALQFHLEARPDVFEQWLIGHAAELANAGVHPETLRKQRLESAQRRDENAWKVLADWLNGTTCNGGPT